MNNGNLQDSSQQALTRKLALWADILRDCSARGLHFSSNIYIQAIFSAFLKHFVCAMETIKRFLISKFSKNTGMHEIRQLITRVEQQYGLQIASIHPLNSDTGKHIYRIDLADGKCMILRNYSSGDHNLLTCSLVNLLQFLEYKDYPAERLISTIDNAVIDTYDDQQLIITTFIEGTTVDYVPATLYKLGATLGKLHALNPLEAGTISLSIAPAQMRMAPELAYATKRLVDVGHLVSYKLSKRYNMLLEAMQTIDVREDLPNVIIHNDCHPGNSILIPSGKVVMIDWEGGGIGSAVLDVGFLLVSCDATMPWMPSIPIKMFHAEVERINAVIDGYCQYHRLSTAELDRLLDAMRFRSIVFGACRFASVITGRLENKSLWWETRYDAVEEIAEIARKRFAMYWQKGLS